MATEYTGEVIPATEYTGDVIPIDKPLLPFQVPPIKTQQTNPPMSFWDKAGMLLGALPTAYKNVYGGVTEPIAQQLTGIAAKPAGEIAAGGTIAANTITGNYVDPQAIQKEVQSKLTYQPTTSAGQSEYNPLNAIPHAIGGVIGYGAQNIGRSVDQLQGLPQSGEVQTPLGLGAQEAAMQGVGLLGMKKAGKIAEGSADVMAKTQAELDILKAENSAKDKIQKEGNKIGLYAPAETGVKQLASNVTRANQVLSNKNSAVLTKELKPEVGMGKGDNFGSENIQSALENEYKAYDNLIKESQLPQTKTVKSSILGVNEKPITTTENTIGLKVEPIKDSLIESRKNLAAEMEFSPETFKANTPSLKLIDDFLNMDVADPKMTLNAIKRLRSDAKKDLNGTSATAATQANGAVKLDVANQLEKMFEDNLASNGKQATVDAFRDARKRIAKLHVIEQIVDPAGNVNLNKLANLPDKVAGSLDGKLKTAYDFARTFKEVAKTPTTKGAIGAGDVLIGMGGLATGHLALTGAQLLGRAGVPYIAGKGLLQNKMPSYQISGMQGMLSQGVPATVGGISASLPSQNMLTGQ